MPRVLRDALLALLACPALVLLASSDARGGDDPELLALMTLLEEETTLATQTRMNADYVPGMVSVLQGDDLRTRGLSTVADALGLVAGFYTTVNNAGDTRVIVRGAGATLNASNLKILIDGVAVNRATDASADWALRLPISQVDRIEVIRGPGSALYGEFAFAGVVNVISRKGNGAGVQVGSHNARQANGWLERSFDNGASLRLNLSAWRHDDSGLRTNRDNFANSGHGHSPGRVYDNERGRLLLSEFGYQGYRLQLQHAVVEHGGWYGRTAAMPRDLDPRVEKVTNVTLSKTWEITDHFSLGALLSSLDTDLANATYLPIPAGINPPGPAPVRRADDFRRDGNSDSTRRAEINLRWSALDGHTLYMGAGYAHSRVEGAFMERFETGRPVRRGTPSENRVLAGSERRLRSFTVQDQWQLTDALELTLGVRHDNYDDWGSHTSPRLAAVWRAGEHHIFKAQYAEAFRPPTLEERYPGPDAFPGGTTTSDLKEERIRSTEAAYIYRKAGRKLRTTLFHTRIDDLIEFFINPGDPPIWRNRGDIETRGVELEWEQEISRRWSWFANVSYVDAEDRLDSDGRLLGAVDWLGNLGVTWRRDGGTSHSLLLRYVDEQEGWELRTRTPHTPRFDAYTTLDYTFSWRDVLAVDGLRLDAGIKNLTDRSYESVPTPAQYPEGLTHGERTVWLRLEYAYR